MVGQTGGETASVGRSVQSNMPVSESAVAAPPMPQKAIPDASENKLLQPDSGPLGKKTKRFGQKAPLRLLCRMSQFGKMPTCHHGQRQTLKLGTSRNL